MMPRAQDDILCPLAVAACSKARLWSAVSMIRRGMSIFKRLPFSGLAMMNLW